jgi:hypothetical protein
LLLELTQSALTFASNRNYLGGALTPVHRRAHQLKLQAYGWNVGLNGTVHENKIGADENTG